MCTSTVTTATIEQGVCIRTNYWCLFQQRRDLLQVRARALRGVFDVLEEHRPLRVPHHPLVVLHTHPALERVPARVRLPDPLPVAGNDVVTPLRPERPEVQAPPLKDRETKSDLSAFNMSISIPERVKPTGSQCPLLENRIGVRTRIAAQGTKSKFFAPDISA